MSAVDDLGEGKLYADVVDVVVSGMVEVWISSERSFAVVRQSCKIIVIRSSLMVVFVMFSV